MNVGIFSTASFLSALIVAKYIWKPMKDNPATFPSIPFFCKYAYLLYDNDDTKDHENLEDMMQNVIMEHTPEGPVFMRYNHKQESFNYWSNNTIKYKHLDTVARKYVIMYQCKNAYIPKEEEEEKDPSNNEIKEDNIFYTPKKKKKIQLFKMVIDSERLENVTKHLFLKKTNKQTNSFFVGEMLMD
tara:strand:- start:207 stop:764 length:558 start_codon:yes stop_codon:yes gene_type:complete